MRAVSISRVTDPWLTEVVGRLGFDLIWFDMEHRSFGDGVIDQLSLACRSTGIDLMVRIRKGSYYNAMQPLEFGANGIMVPHCNSVEEARQWVEWTFFPPLGNRGFDNAGVDGDYALSDPRQFLKSRNEETFLVLQIEDRRAVECAEAIAHLEGVHLLFVGLADLTISYGVPMQFDHPSIQEAIDKVACAAARAGKWWGMPTFSPEMAQSALDRGGRLITCAFDHFLLVHGLQTAARAYSRIGITQE